MTKITDAKEIVISAIKFNLSIAGKARAAETVIPYLESVPGIGKSAVTEQAAKELGMRLEVVRASEYEPSEAAGWNLPNEAKDKMTRIRPNWMPDGKEPTVVFFDELPQGHTMVQNVIAQVVNERRVGPHILPDNAVVVAAGNAAKDRAGTSLMPTHLRDRLTFIEIEPDVDDAIYYFQEHGIDPIICGYLRWRPDMLSQFDRDAKACPSPRSWERVNSWMRTSLPLHLQHVAICGQIGAAAATDFSAYRKLAAAIPDMDRLIREPEKAEVPTDTGLLYAVAAALVPRFTPATADNIMTYLRRIPRNEIMSFVVYSAVHKEYRSKQATKRELELTKVPSVREWFQKEGASAFRLAKGSILSN